MTICVTIKCRKSEKKTKRPVLLFASDTQESSRCLKRSVTKMREIYGKPPKKHRYEWGVLVGSAGDAMVIDEVLNDIEALLHKRIKADDRPSDKLRLLRKEVGDLAYATYRKYEGGNVADLCACVCSFYRVQSGIMRHFKRTLRGNGSYFVVIGFWVKP